MRSAPAESISPKRAISSGHGSGVTVRMMARQAWRNLASKARVDLILTQNKRMAVAVGKYAKDRDPVVEARFPSWIYHCGRNPRPEHKALDGKIFLKNDPIWRKIFPPWEFNCNCWVENSDKTPSGGITAAQIQPPASGYQFDPSDAFEDYKVDRYHSANLSSGNPAGTC